MTTGISWTDETWNCIRGCSRVSEGCRNCYAERTALRMSGDGKPYAGLVTSILRQPMSDKEHVEARWTGEVRFVAKDLIIPLGWKEPRRIFVNSMSDLFHKGLTINQIAAVFGVMAACPHHTFQVLTKRAREMREWFEVIATVAAENGMPPAAYCFAQAQRIHQDELLSAGDGAAPGQRRNAVEIRPYRRTPLSRGSVVEKGISAGWPLPNVWIGVSTENQETYNERILDLIATPARYRFLSCEPLLSPIQLELVGTVPGDVVGGAYRAVYDLLHWVIVGCESGPRARPCPTDWIRMIRDQCIETKMPVFIKQALRDYNADSYGEPAVHGMNKHPDVRVPKKGKALKLFETVESPLAPKTKPGGVIERPYVDGKQYLEFPA